MADSRFIEVNGVTYHTTRHGSPQSPTLLLLHGFTGSNEYWLEHRATFATQLCVVTVDLLGHGRSASPPDPNRYAMPRAAADIVALLDAWQIEQTALLGYSMGGRLALYLASHFAQRFSRLILESASPGLAAATERAARRHQDNDLAAWIEANGLTAFVNRWKALPLWASQAQLPEPVRQKVRQQRLQNNPLGLANSLRGMGTGAQPSLWPQLTAMEIPTLLIVGELDKKFVGINQKIVAKLPKGRLEIIPDAGHTTHLERPSLFQAAVLNFLLQANAAI